MTMHQMDHSFMREALRLAREGIEQHHGGPFGAVVAIEDEIVGRGWNQVVLKNDPTAHAEILAIREACRRLGRFHLDGATLFSSCEPCPMCLSAAYWAHIDNIVFAASADDVAAIGFADQRIKDALNNRDESGAIAMRQLLREECLDILQQWRADSGSINY